MSEHLEAIRFGTYMHEWEARDVAASLRRKGHRVSVRSAHAYHWTVWVA